MVKICRFSAPVFEFMLLESGFSDIDIVTRGSTLPQMVREAFCDTERLYIDVKSNIRITEKMKRSFFIFLLQRVNSDFYLYDFIN